MSTRNEENKIKINKIKNNPNVIFKNVADL
jgi:hypothetical protein